MKGIKETDVRKRILGFRHVGYCDDCKHAVGYYENYKKLIHFLDLFPDDELSDETRRTHCNNPSFGGQTEEKMTLLASLFSMVKQRADERRQAFEEFKNELETALNIELPYGFDAVSEIDWQDVLVWGIEDASFEEFMKDLELYRKQEGF